MTRGIAKRCGSHIGVCLSAVALERPGACVAQCGGFVIQRCQMSRLLANSDYGVNQELANQPFLHFALVAWGDARFLEFADLLPFQHSPIVTVATNGLISAFIEWIMGYATAGIGTV